MLSQLPLAHLLPASKISLLLSLFTFSLSLCIYVCDKILFTVIFVGFGERVRLKACFQSIIIPTWLFLDTVMISLLSLFSSSGFNYALLGAPRCPETAQPSNPDEVPDRAVTHVSFWLVVGTVSAAESPFLTRCSVPKPQKPFKKLPEYIFDLSLFLSVHWK